MLIADPAKSHGPFSEKYVFRSTGQGAGQGGGQGRMVAGQNRGREQWGANLDNALNTRAIWVSVECSCQLGKRQMLVPIR